MMYYLSFLLLVSSVVFVFSSSSEDSTEDVRLKKGLINPLMSLPGLSEEAKKELDGIMKKMDATIAQKQEDLKAWASKQGDEAVKKFDEVKENMNTFNANFKKALEDSTISPELKKALQEIEAVHNDKSLTIQQEIDKMKAIKNGLPDEIKKQMKEFLKKIMPQRKKRNDATTMMPPIGQNGRLMLPPPSGVTEKSGQAFTAIINDPKLTNSQIVDKLLEWSMTESPEIQSKIKALIDDAKNAGKKIKEELANAKLSDKAKEAINKMAEIFEDMNLTLAQEVDQLNAVLNSLPEDVKAEVDMFMADSIKNAINSSQDDW